MVCCAGQCSALNDTKNCGYCGGACLQGDVCSAGFCVPGCQTNENCTDGMVCLDGVCSAPGADAGPASDAGVPDAGAGSCTTDSDCAAGHYCSMGTCLVGCSNDSECPTGLVCQDNACSGGLSCTADTDCMTGDYCSMGLCLVGCSMSSECSTGDVCSHNECAPACGASGACDADGGLTCCTNACVNLMTDANRCGGCDSPACGAGQSCCGGTCASTDSDPNNCGGCDQRCTGQLDCCSGVCADTMSTAAANCGGCGLPACETGNNCCSGGCSDPRTDADNCGGCGQSCTPPYGSCVDGACVSTSATVGLFGVAGSMPVNGVTTSVQTLLPLVSIATGPSPTLDQLVSGFCVGQHYDTSQASTGQLNAGTITIGGYTGGTFLDGGTAPQTITCQFTNHAYACDYGGTSNSAAGSPFPPTADPMGATSPAIGFTAAGGSQFGSFSVDTVPPAPTQDFTVMEDLTAIAYRASAPQAFHLVCAGSPCPTGGAIVVVVQASPNDPAHLGAPSTTFGYASCIQLYGTYDGITFGTVPPIIIVPQSAIADMLGGDSTLKTFVTTVANIPAGTTGLNMTDSEGHAVVPLAGRGVFGISTQ
jgi:hypothetical protein